MTMNDDVRDMSYHLEVQKYSVRQNNKEGIIFSVRINPQDCPHDILTSNPGTRYVMALCQVDDDESPTMGPAKQETSRVVAAAGALCRNERFQKWALSNTYGLCLEAGTAEDETTAWLRVQLNINSRSDLENNSEAREKFFDIREQFTKAVQEGKV